MKVVTAEGTHEKMGFDLGCQLREAIRHNLNLREQDARARGIEKREFSRFAHEYAALSSASSLHLMEGMSRGSGLPFESILGFNALQDVLSPEGCTTFAAVGKATSDGKAVLLKNRDQRGNRGNYEFNSSGYYKNREVNITLALKMDDGNTIVGVTVAGLTMIMMGLNKYGVAAASNFGQAKEIFGQAKEISHLSSKELYRIGGRPQMLREGLECSSAQDAVNLALAKLTESPMGNPGILWFVDARNIYVIEGGSINNQFAVQHVTDGATSRSNHFLLLDQLNNEKAVSSICRKIRASELVEENFGSINREKLIEFSMDHKNGPYNNSICCHSKNPEEPATVSASIMEIDNENPQQSKISIALGSPCWSWSNKGGNITFQMDEDIESIPQRFLDGSAYKEFIRAEPFPE